ncbi:unnamed protein product [Caenorhabditis brenneri]
MALFLSFMGVANLVLTNAELTALGYSESQRFVIKLAMKVFVTTTYIFTRFYARPFMNQMAVLRTSAVVIALTVAWIPCLTAYPTLSVILKFIEVFFFTIGPFVIAPLQMYRIFGRNVPCFDALQAVFGNPILFGGIFFYGYQGTLPRPPPVSHNQFVCFFAVVLYAVLVFNGTLDKNRRLDEQAERRGIIV